MSTTRILQFTGADLRVTKLGVSSNVEVGSANLFVDTSTGRVGVGTTNPAESLHLYKTGGVGAPGNPAPKLLFQHYPSATSAAWGDITGEVCLNYMPYHSGEERGVGIYAYRNSYTSDKSASLNMYVTNGESGIIDPALRITETGNVGIGLTNPGTPLHVSSSNFVSDAVGPAASANTVVRFSSTESDSTLLFGLSDTASYISSFSKTGFSTKRNLILNANGANVGIGLANPTDGLHVSTTLRTDFNRIQTGSGSAGISDGIYIGTNMAAGQGGGAVQLTISAQNSNGATTATWVYILRKYYSNAASVSPWTAKKEVWASNNLSGVTGVVIYTDSSGKLKFYFTGTGSGAHYKWSVIELI